MQKRVFRTNLDVAQIVEGHVNSNVMAIVLERCFLLSVLIVAKRLQYRLSPVATDQSIVEIVIRQGVAAIRTNTLKRGVGTPLFYSLLSPDKCPIQTKEHNRT